MHEDRNENLGSVTQGERSLNKHREEYKSLVRMERKAGSALPVKSAGEQTHREF